MKGATKSRRPQVLDQANLKSVRTARVLGACAGQPLRRRESPSVEGFLAFRIGRL